MFKNSKKTMDEYFGVKIVKAMKQRSDEYTIKTKKIDTKTVIVFGNSKKKDDYYFGKDFLNLKSQSSRGGMRWANLIAPCRFALSLLSLLMPCN